MILTALNDYYQRLADENKVPLPGFSSEKVSFCLVFSQDGKPLQIIDLRDTTGKKPRPSPCQVPVDKRRTSGIHAYPLWDKTAYALGVSAGEGKRLVDEHDAFKERQRALFGESDDPYLIAFLRLLDQWMPEQLIGLPGYSEEVLDTNIIFRLDGQRQYLHENHEARRLWGAALESGEGELGQCLITGEIAPLGTDHPAIRGVRDAQSSGASLVSFNSDAYESYGYSKNQNASISKSAIFGYSTALNYLLRGDTDNRQRLQIGDATVVFWARARDAAHAEAAEDFFAMLNEPPSDEQEAAKLGTLLTDISQGRPLQELDPLLEPDTQFFVLGLAPNAARLSVRFWYVDSLERLAQHYAQHHKDMLLEPIPWKGVMPGVRRLALQTAPIRGDWPKAEDVLPQLAGEMMRSVLTGCRYPQSLLNNIVMRFRSDGGITGLRVALCKAVLARDARLVANSNFNYQEVPVSLDQHCTNASYLLGRLFAELENAQREALGKEVNATIRDRYYGAASATPANVFPMLTRGVVHHFSRIRKDKRENVAYAIEKKMGEIMKKLPAEFPKHLSIQEQGKFAIGYYQQKWTRQQENADEASPGDME
ncbi:type I-C CRISPR-associated protein Cas8c/Csd1 [Halomonas daqingensis]|uniref:type I-C CRISPR-associated protein Cas8c/Csd1 n=1 Tax=Halomonadaceae TaxID=28256 RepID=UPI000287D448|nr:MULTISPECIES: type I-C CRISPR-associated protein Cas8c/Csd1 [Halomonas]MCE8030338.1 type I-C CRISPR-associated protein Cas8c/Csd1 [Halomonas desiderata]NIC38546.1 type I-C CRISPR-associated protein Cas8c/Csd1 [Halomonas desiderata]SEG21734.1 CRISPR-associated protein, Csd1 family [Halomonas desiderata]